MAMAIGHCRWGNLARGGDGLKASQHAWDRDGLLVLAGPCSLSSLGDAFLPGLTVNAMKGRLELSQRERERERESVCVCERESE